MLGIECDGAMYHSAKNARDRDKLREGILRDLGWEIHRIWSTDCGGRIERASWSGSEVAGIQEAMGKTTAGLIGIGNAVG